MSRIPPLPGLIWVLGTDGVDERGVWQAWEIGRRIRWVVAQMKAEGRSLFMNEGLREAGIYSDRFVKVASQTSTGGGNAWFYVGQADRKEISSALPPTGPNPTKHMKGEANDSNAPTQLDMQRRTYFMKRVGMEATVAGESWHFEITGPVDSDIDLTPYSYTEQEDGFLMALSDQEQRAIRDNTKSLVEAVGRLEQLIGNASPIRAFNNGRTIEVVNVNTGKKVNIPDVAFSKLYHEYDLFVGSATNIPDYVLAHFRDLMGKLGSPETTPESAQKIADELVKLLENNKA